MAGTVSREERRSGALDEKTCRSTETAQASGDATHVCIEIDDQNEKGRQRQRNRKDDEREERRVLGNVALDRDRSGNAGGVK